MPHCLTPLELNFTKKPSLTVASWAPAVAIPDVELVEPTVERAPGEVEVPYRLYRAHRPHGGLICWVHGGPNDQWQVTFRSQFTYWLSRGFAIAVVDHRGSSGHGRDFMMSLNGHWGEYDAIDTTNVLHHPVP